MPKKVTIVISDEIYDRLQDMDLNPTQICEYMIKWFMSSEYDKDLGKLFKIEAITKKILKTKVELSELEDKQMLLKELERILDITKQDYNASRHTLYLNDILLKLDKGIIINHYDKKTIEEKYKNTIEEIKSLMCNFDLVRRIRRVKQIYNYDTMKMEEKEPESDD